MDKTVRQSGIRVVATRCSGAKAPDENSLGQSRAFVQACVGLARCEAAIEEAGVCPLERRRRSAAVRGIPQYAGAAAPSVPSADMDCTVQTAIHFRFRVFGEEAGQQSGDPIPRLVCLTTVCTTNLSANPSPCTPPLILNAIAG